MSDIIDFKPKSKTYAPLFELAVSTDPDGKFEVSMEAEEDCEDFQIYIALQCIIAKMEIELGFEDIIDFDEDLLPANDNGRTKYDH